jgi:hypothetical protein
MTRKPSRRVAMAEESKTNKKEEKLKYEMEQPFTKKKERKDRHNSPVNSIHIRVAALTALIHTWQGARRPGRRTD